MGKIIVIEGARDGIGKSTQLKLLSDRLVKEGYKVASHHFPSYNTYQGKGAQEYLSGKWGSVYELSPYFINNLYAYDRIITWLSELKSKYDEGYIILLDRYTTSSLIYQSSLIEDINKRKEFIDYVSDFEYNKLGLKEPDMVIFLNAPYDLVSSMMRDRKDNAGIKDDIHERDDKFLRKVYDNALFVSSYLSFDVIPCNKDNKMDSIDNIHKEIYARVRKII